MILETLKEAGHQAFFVGGCVRDTLMGITPKDWDIATSATPDQVVALFPNALTVGAKFGVVIVNGHEIATFRKEADHNGHTCSVQWTDLHTDASRRDFTINAMYMDSDGIIDLFGGKKDIEMNVLRTVGRAERRFQEDPLRMLRAVRFASRFGMVLSDEILSAMNGSLLSTISQERIKDELVKILALGGLRLLSDCGLLSHILPEIEQLKEVEQDFRHPEGNVFEHTVRCLDAVRDFGPKILMAVLLHDVGKFETFEQHWTGKISFLEHENSLLPERIMQRLKFSNDEIESVIWLVANHMRMHKFFEMKKSKRHTLMRHKDFSLLRWVHYADCVGGMKGTDEVAMIDNYCATVTNWEPKVLSDRIISGNDLIALGLKQGKALGAILAQLEEAQREGVFKTKEEGLDFYRTL